MKINLPEDVRQILLKLKENGQKAYIVGGCVRDAILGKQPHDWDICTSAMPEEIQEIFREEKLLDVGLKHGTVTVVRDSGLYEITTFRVDGEYTDARHPDSVIFVADVKADLARRDFTVNAIVYNEEEGIVDPFHGKQDISYGIIRCVGDPEARFREDALRILRALRFSSQLSMKIDPDTRAAIFKSAHLLKKIARERVSSELQKMLLGQNCLSVLLEYKEIIADILPSLQPCIGFAQNNRYHLYNVYDHIMYAVAGYRGEDVAVKLALLLHDVGKPGCYSEDERGGHFYGHPAVSRQLAEPDLLSLKLDKRKFSDILELIEFHDMEIVPTKKAIRKALAKFGEDQLERLFQVRMADIAAHSPINKEERLQSVYEAYQIFRELLQKEQRFSLKQLAINGNDLLNLGIPEGKQIGIILNALAEAVISESLGNDREILIEETKRIRNSLPEQ